VKSIKRQLYMLYAARIRLVLELVLEWRFGHQRTILFRQCTQNKHSHGRGVFLASQAEFSRKPVVVRVEANPIRLLNRLIQALEFCHGVSGNQTSSIHVDVSPLSLVIFMAYPPPLTFLFRVIVQKRHLGWCRPVKLGWHNCSFRVLGFGTAPPHITCSYRD
jgi:hypothetical protein